MIETLKEWYVTTLLICFGGVFCLFSYYGYLQEALLRDKELALNVNFVTGVETAFSCLFALVIIKAGNMGPLFAGTLTKGDLIVGLLNFFSKFFTNLSLKYVNYPVTVLAKSAKVIFTILVGSIRGIYKPNFAQVCIAITITAGLIVFNSGKMGGLDEDSNIIGIGLVFGSLVLDGVSSSETDKIHKAEKREFAYHSMFYTNLVSMGFNCLFYIATRLYQGDNTFENVVAKNDVLMNVLSFGICGGAGQIFIFLTISLHNCLTLSIMTTCRKCFSMVISAYFFNHSFT